MALFGIIVAFGLDVKTISSWSGKERTRFILENNNLCENSFFVRKRTKYNVVTIEKDMEEVD